MTTKAYQRRLTELLDSVNDHPHRDELIKLMKEQVEDDKYSIE